MMYVVWQKSKLQGNLFAGVFNIGQEEQRL
jgi:hypothetical protein